MKMPRPKKVNLEPPTGSMGDIAFLLIIFFMLTTTIADESKLDAELPMAEKLETLGDSIKVSVSIDRHGVIAYNRKRKWGRMK